MCNKLYPDREWYWCGISAKRYSIKCNGDEVLTEWASCGEQPIPPHPSCEVCYEAVKLKCLGGIFGVGCGVSAYDTYYDLRTDEQKLNGCCPYQAL